MAGEQLARRHHEAAGDAGGGGGTLWDHLEGRQGHTVGHGEHRSAFFPKWEVRPPSEGQGYCGEIGWKREFVCMFTEGVEFIALPYGGCKRPQWKNDPLEFILGNVALNIQGDFK